MSFALISYSKDLINIFLPQKFHESYIIVTPVVVGCIFLGLFNIYAQYIGYTKKTVYSSVVLLSSGIINILLNVWLIPIFGYQIAAYTTLISYFFLFFFAWITSKYILKMKIIPLWLIIKPFIILCISIVFFSLLSDIIINFIILFIFKSFLPVVFGLFILKDDILKLLKKPSE